MSKSFYRIAIGFSIANLIVQLVLIYVFSNMTFSWSDLNSIQNLIILAVVSSSIGAMLLLFYFIKKRYFLPAVPLILSIVLYVVLMYVYWEMALGRMDPEIYFSLHHVHEGMLIALLIFILISPARKRKWLLIYALVILPAAGFMLFYSFNMNNSHLTELQPIAEYVSYFLVLCSVFVILNYHSELINFEYEDDEVLDQ